MLIDKLVDGSMWENWRYSGDGNHFERMRKRDGYAKIPERMKPGRAIMGLTDEERETLKRATAKDFNHRQIGK